MEVARRNNCSSRSRSLKLLRLSETNHPPEPETRRSGRLVCTKEILQSLIWSLQTSCQSRQGSD
ncbi:unnamed protein product [Penicillium roqueforti FM164]|uniref:Genomic scaffold, ProqFM164S03 n=1 Tax=Penicillium roqueforti (strain FM164) TaxID=1365484 RepID=W6QDI5_PENRF|nr:unnamed protein product [Penicillium roqueforti FM164]